MKWGSAWSKRTLVSSRGPCLVRISWFHRFKTESAGNLFDFVEFVEAFSNFADTTRPPKGYEEPDRDYHFTSRDIFDSMIYKNRWVGAAVLVSSVFDASLGRRWSPMTPPIERLKPHLSRFSFSFTYPWGKKNMCLAGFWNMGSTEEICTAPVLSPWKMFWTAERSASLTSSQM